MSDSYRSRERKALAPLLELARGKSARELQEWLEYLRAEGPTVAARLERLLAEGGERASTGDSEVGAGDDSSRDGAAEGGADGGAAHVSVIPLPLPPRTGESTRGESAHERPERKRYVAPALSYGLLVR